MGRIVNRDGDVVERITIDVPPDSCVLVELGGAVRVHPAARQVRGVPATEAEGGGGVTLTYYYECRACDWEPDPDRRMAEDNQAEQHTRESGHCTVTGMRP